MSVDKPMSRILRSIAAIVLGFGSGAGAGWAMHQADIFGTVTVHVVSFAVSFAVTLTCLRLWGRP